MSIQALYVKQVRIPRNCNIYSTIYRAMLRIRIDKVCKCNRDTSPWMPNQKYVWQRELQFGRDDGGSFAKHLPFVTHIRDLQHPHLHIVCIKLRYCITFCILCILWICGFSCIYMFICAFTWNTTVLYLYLHIWNNTRETSRGEGISYMRTTQFQGSYMCQRWGRDGIR